MTLSSLVLQLPPTDSLATRWGKAGSLNNTLSLPATPVRKLRLRDIQAEATREAGFYPSLGDTRALKRTGLSCVWNL